MFLGLGLRVNSPDQDVTETGAFGIGVRPTKCFNTHRGSVFNTGKGSATTQCPVSSVNSLSPRGTILAWLLVQLLLRNGRSHRRPQLGTTSQISPPLPPHTQGCSGRPVSLPRTHPRPTRRIVATGAARGSTREPHLVYPVYPAPFRSTEPWGKCLEMPPADLGREGYGRRAADHQIHPQN